MKKQFIIQCKGCNWLERSTGLTRDLQHLNEIKNSCKNCGKPRQFRCPRCGGTAKMFRTKS